MRGLIRYSLRPGFSGLPVVWVKPRALRLPSRAGDHVGQAPGVPREHVLRSRLVSAPGFETGEAHTHFHERKRNAQQGEQRGE